MAWTGFDSTYQSFQNTSTAARVAGVPELLEDTIVVPIADAAADAQATLVYKAEEVTVDKKAVAISEGELVRMDTAGADAGEINVAVAAAANVACGFALHDSAATELTMRIRFDGTPRGA